MLYESSYEYEYEESLNNSINSGDTSYIKNMLKKYKHLLNPVLVKNAISIITELSDEKLLDLLENLELNDSIENMEY
tara:strand:+ start:5043 stop:5273 length:231 start_codon:yes stop_codon:yes gene_type:complete